MRKNKPAAPSILHRLRLTRAGLIRVCIAAVAVSFVWALYQRLKGFPVFSVREVIVRQDGAVRSETEHFGLFKSTEHIYARSGRGIAPYRPASRVTTSAPDQFFIRTSSLVDFIKRRPLACIQLGRPAYLDEKPGRLFSFPARGNPGGRLSPDEPGLSADFGQRLASAHAADALA